MTTPSALQDGFTRSHRFLDETFDKARGAIGGADGDLAAAAFRGFWDTIEAHMSTEEERLFPVYETRHGPDNPLTGILRKGHRDLRGFFEEISETIAGQDFEEAAALMDTVSQILAHHDEKEEHEFYPAVAPLIPDPHDIFSRLIGPPLGGAP